MPHLVWLVTGCSSGFGLEFVHQIRARGDLVIATARNQDKMHSLQGTGTTLLELDVTSTQSVIDTVMAKAVAVHGRVDVLVNNAGFVMSGSWEDLRYEKFLASFDVNVFGPIKVTRAILPHFRKNAAGTMVFISSLSGWIGHGFTGAYASSKFALEGAVESLYQETKSLGLRTLLMEPGRFRTNLLSQDKAEINRSSIDDYRQASDVHSQGLQQEDLRQPGDPKKFVQIVIDLVKQEGCAAGKEVPFRLPVGTDAVEEIRGKLESTTRVLEDWNSIILGTGFAEST